MQQQQWAGVLLGAVVAFTAAADTTDVDKLSGVSGYSPSGADLTLAVVVDNGASLLVVIGISGADANRLVNTVKLVDTPAIDPEPVLDFVRVGYEDSTDWDIRVEIWKLDNKQFEVNGGDETEYDEIQIDFPVGNAQTYAYAFELGDQNAVDIVRLFAADQDASGTVHNIDPFVLEPDAMVISAHLYTNGLGVTASGNRTEDWDKALGTEGFYVQHATPNAADTHEMKVTTNVDVDSITCGVIIRSEWDIIHTPAGSPGTLGDASTAGWWLEGLTATSDGTRQDINNNWGAYITQNKATWLRGNICDGNSNGNNRDIGDENDGHDLDPTDFSPLNPDRERHFEDYLTGLEENLDNTLDPFSGIHRHISSWNTYGGVVVWDLEFFCLDYGGNGSQTGTKWGPPDAFDPTAEGTEMVEWEYDAAVRYYWERVHQWFLHVYTNEGVEALIFYHHPQQPTKSQGLDENWAGRPWQDDSHWIYKMQGAFDGHCYAPIRLGPDNAVDIKTWCRNVFENFQSIADELNVYSYVSHFPSRPGFEGYQSAVCVRAIIDASDAIRNALPTAWTDFDEFYYGGIPLGRNWNDSFVVVSVDLANDEFRIDGDQVFEFDPFDTTIEIQDSAQNNGTYTISVSGVSYDGGSDKTVIPVDEEIQGTFTPLGNLITPAKDVADFVSWWKDILVGQLADKYDTP